MVQGLFVTKDLKNLPNLLSQNQKFQLTIYRMTVSTKVCNIIQNHRHHSLSDINYLLE